ncbi:hypothetical protein TIFTF001_027357 [Ficus carica]|uniref:Uncharacterized protein n=1 Tax=Ficus carica TaxID=3494 RepID=A0AA88J051_FICCA|nr:hypothetical protein TIFTF001_027357 [Ficus carica]
MGYHYWVLVRCPKVTFSNRIGHHVSRGHITRESNLLLQFAGATNPSSSITKNVPSKMLSSFKSCCTDLHYELDWAGRPNHSMAACHGTYTLIVLAERKLTTYVYAVDKYGNGLRKAGRYRVGIRADSCLPVSQYACQRHRHWEPAMSRGTWVDFRALITVRYGLPPDGDANMPYRDPEIFNDMYLERFLSYVVDWGAYPNESMGHYCRRFQEAMLPHILPALGSPLLQALFLLREGLCNDPPIVGRYLTYLLTTYENLS